MYAIKDINKDKAWAANQKKQITGEGFVRLEYKISDPDLPPTEAQPNGELDLLSRACEITKDIDREVPGENKIVPYATLEQDLWLLDGSKVTVPANPDDYGYSGFISKVLCGENRVFSPRPLIRIDFGKIINILPGLTITWGMAHEDYPTKFSVTAFKDKIAYSPKLITGNENVITVVAFEMKEFDRVEIEIQEWKDPFRRARIGKILLGIHKFYEKADLLNFSGKETVDPLSMTLPKNEISFSIDNRFNEFNPANPEGLTKYMMERQEIRTSYGYRLENKEIEWIPGGIYYLSDWSAPQNGLAASFIARDLLGFMNAAYYKGVFPNPEEWPGGISLYELAERVLNEAKLPKDRDGKDFWKIDASLHNIFTWSPLPVCRVAECLQLIANAARAAIYFTRDGRLNINPLDKRDSNDEITIDADHSYSKAEISLTKPVKQIDISMFGYREEGKKELYKGTLTLNKGENEFMLEHSDLVKACEITVNGTGIRVLERESFAKFTRLVLESPINGTSCEVNISGTIFKPAETIITVPNLPAGEILPFKNDLITTVSHAQDVGIWLKENTNRRKSFTVDWRADPRVDAGDIALIQAANTMRITSSSFSFNGAFKGKSEGVEVNEY
ncbi:MAG: hypothetical protein FWE14_09310 [Lachnospiraceae bacterium]|nr:hypothetical protein [Lachnospiraceae bacterium]